jgi:hypothetical protein
MDTLKSSTAPQIKDDDDESEEGEAKCDAEEWRYP